MRRSALLALVVLSCRSQPQTVPTRDIAAIAPPSSAVSVKLVPDPSASGVELGPGEEYSSPQLSPSNKPPLYPPQLVALALPPHTISVRVTFDEKGSVLRVDASPVAETTTGEHSASFRAAVDEAVGTWRCFPGRIRKFRPGPDSDADGKADFRILVAERVLKTFFDLSFTFEVVNGVPVVRTGQRDK